MVSFSDETLAVIMPVITYWVTAGIYELLAYQRPDARLHTKEEELAANIPSRWTVTKSVLCQQTFQTLFILAFLNANFNTYFSHLMMAEVNGFAKPQPSLLVATLQFIGAMVILDAVQYFSHRFMHMNKFLYKHFHSVHHSMVVSYPIGSLYSSLFESFVWDTVGGVLATALTGMTARTNMYFLVFVNIRTVDIHSGLWLPWSPSQLLFSNNQAFHDAHHQLKGRRYNFSQPFFVAWDKILGTYMPYTVVKREGGGYEAKMMKGE